MADGRRGHGASDGQACEEEPLFEEAFGPLLAKTWGAGMPAAAAAAPRARAHCVCIDSADDIVDCPPPQVDYKQAEWQSYSDHVSQWEVDRYLKQF